MNQFTINLASTQSAYRPGDMGASGEKHFASGTRGVFARSVWPFLVNVRRDPEGQLVVSEKGQSGFSS